MKVGDLVRVRMPGELHSGINCILVEKNVIRSSAMGDDIWWNVLRLGLIKEVHQDYIRDVINEDR